jgi:hypothetical protein
MTRVRISRAFKKYQIDKEADGFSPHSIQLTFWSIQRLSDYLGIPYLDCTISRIHHDCCVITGSLFDGYWGE